MAEPAKHIATYADLQAAPAHQVAEIVDGELYTLPRPSFPHARAQAELSWWLGPRFQKGNNGPGGWWIVNEPELHLHADICVPDLAGWRKTRMPRFPSTEFVSLAPDWICEVVSPSTAGFDRVQKMNVYAREGVRHAWLVDPLVRLLEVFELVGGAWTRRAAYRDSVRVRVPPFDEVELDLGELWVDEAQ